MLVWSLPRIYAEGAGAGARIMPAIRARYRASCRAYVERIGYSLEGVQYQ